MRTRTVLALSGGAGIAALGLWIFTQGGLLPAGARASGAHTPRSIVFAVDLSSSMASAMPRLRRGLAEAGRCGLRDGDVVSLVAFDSYARVLISREVVGPAFRKHWAETVARLDESGGTYLAGGFQAAADELAGMPGPNRKMVLVSDGVATEGLRGPALQAHIKEVVTATGIQVVGVGGEGLRAASTKHIPISRTSWERGILEGLAEDPTRSGRGSCCRV